MTGSWRSSTWWPVVRRWSGVVVPPVAWGVRLLAGWALAEAACAAGYSGSFPYLAVQSTLIVLTVAVSLWSGWLALTEWRRGDRGSGWDPVDVPSFLGLTGMLNAVVFTLLILVEGSAAYVVPC